MAQALTFDWYPAVLYALDKISQGLTKTRACAEANLPVAVFNKYVAADEDLKMMLEEAQTVGNDALADALLNPFNNAEYGNTDANKAKLVSDNIKWLLAKRDNKRFGDRIEVKHEVTLDRAITDAMFAGRQRAEQAVQRIAAPTEDVIDAEIITDEEYEIAELLR